MAHSDHEKHDNCDEGSTWRVLSWSPREPERKTWAKFIIVDFHAGRKLRSIIDAHGGRLWVDANEPKGTIFQFAIPSEERISIVLLRRLEPHEDTVVDGSHPTVFEGSKQPHPSKRERGRDRRRRPS
jgi:hypothetical protein